MKNNNLEIRTKIKLIQDDGPEERFTFINSLDLIVPQSEEEQSVKIKKLFENMHYMAQKELRGDIHLEESTISMTWYEAPSITTMQALWNEIESIKSLVVEKLTELRITECELILYGNIV